MKVLSYFNPFSNQSKDLYAMMAARDFLACFLFHQMIVHVAKSDTNLALYKPTVACSSYSGHSPGNVVDDNIATDWSQGSCWSVSISGDLNPWWQVDLEAEVAISEVTVYGRTDCCGERVHDFAVDLYSEDPTLEQTRPRRCAFHKGTVISSTTLHCTRPVKGRFLRISGKNTLDINDLFTLCEVQAVLETTSHWKSCSTFTLLQGHRLDTAGIEDREVESSAECATLCEADVSCVGFNVNVQQGLLCQLVQDPDVGNPVLDSSWNSYVFNPCFEPCEY